MADLTSIVADRFEHPLLATILVVSVLFFSAATATELGLLDTNGFVPAFFGVFGVLTFAISLIGYGMIAGAKLISRLRDRTAPTGGA